MKTIEVNDFVELFIEAGKYMNSISGKAEELELVGFPIDWIKEHPEESEYFSEHIGNFRCCCHDEFVSSYGSYNEFSESYQIKLRVKLEDGIIIES